jgi:hypothetical protein
MALGIPVAAAVAVLATAGATPITPAYPAGITANHVLVLVVATKPSPTANSGTCTAPADWALREERLAAGGYGTTLGPEAGNTNLWVFTKNTVTGSESGTLSVTIAAHGPAWAVIIRIPTGGGATSFGATDGEDISAGNVSIAGAADPGFTAGDMALWAMAIPTDIATPAQFSAHTITATGATFGAATELAEPDTATGQDMGGFLAWAMVTAGTSSAAPTVTATAGGTTTNVRGPGVVLRIREAAGAVYVYKGSAGWAARYKGVRSDAALYKGVTTLHP